MRITLLLLWLSMSVVSTTKATETVARQPEKYENSQNNHDVTGNWTIVKLDGKFILNIVYTLQK